MKVMFAAISLSLIATPVWAETVQVRPTWVVPASAEPAPKLPEGVFPECGTAEENRAKAAETLNKLGKDADKLIGQPVSADALSLVNPSERTWFNSIFGINNGKAVCQKVCAVFPADAKNVYYQVGMNDVDGKSGAKLPMSYSYKSHNVDDANLHGWNWAYTYDSEVAFKGNTGLFCTTAKHWIHDKSRDVEIVVTYDK